MVVVLIYITIYLKGTASRIMISREIDVIVDWAVTSGLHIVHASHALVVVVQIVRVHWWQDVIVQMTVACVGIHNWIAIAGTSGRIYRVHLLLCC